MFRRSQPAALCMALALGLTGTAGLAPLPLMAQDSESILPEGAAVPDAPSTPEALEPESAVDAAKAQAAASAPAARLRALDRISGESEDVTLKVGESRDVFRLQVTLSDCRYPVNDPDSNSFAHVTIRDRGDVVFDGWMVAASPALEAMDHPRFDVWVLECLR